MIKKVWMFFIVAVQVVLVVLIALFAYHAGYQVIDWKLIPLLFVCDFIVADIMMYRYLVKRRELKRKQLENEVLSTELGRQTEYYDKVIGQLEAHMSPDPREGQNRWSSHRHDDSLQLSVSRPGC